MGLLIHVMEVNGWFKTSKGIAHPNYSYTFNTWEDAIIACIASASKDMEVY